MADPQDTPQIEGLPPGAVVKPLAAAPQPQIEGLPPGAVVKPIGKQYSGIGQDQDPAEVAARHARANAALSPQEVAARKADPNAPESDIGDNLRIGIGKEGLKTAQGVVGLANKGLAAAQNLDLSGKVEPGTLQIPVPGKELDTEPRGVAQTVGGLGENIAEFAAGDEVLMGLSKLAKVPEAVLALAEKYPKIAKIFTAGAKGAAVGGAQGAVKESAPGGIGAVKGAEAGAVGGGAGGAAAETIGEVVRPVAKAMGIGTSAEEDIMRAAQPGKRNQKFLEDWATAQPRLVEELKEGGKYKDFGEAADRIGDVRRKIWTEEVMPAIDRHADEVFDTTKVANSVRSKITPTLEKNFPEDAKVLHEFADKYTSGTPLFSGDKTVADAEKEIELYNAKLTDAGYWKKTPKERAAMEAANPKIAAWRTASNEIRSGLYEHLDKAGEKGMAALKNEYGAIGNVENEVRGQVNVSGRQRPISLKQIIALASGHPIGIAAALMDKIYNDPAALLNRAVAKSEPAGPVKQAAQAVVSATGTAAKKAAPATGALMIRFIASDGSTHEVPVNKFQEAKKLDPGLQQLESGAHFQQ